METRDAFVEKMKQKLDEWNDDIDKLEDKLAEAREAASKEIESRLTQAREQCAEFREKVETIRGTEKPWDTLKDEAEHVWKVLKQSANYFRSQL